MPGWIDGEAWSAFVEHRQQLQAPLTQRAAGLVLKKLDRLRRDGHDPNAVLDQSLERGWKGVFPLAADRSAPAGDEGRPSPADAYAENFAVARAALGLAGAGVEGAGDG